MSSRCTAARRVGCAALLVMVLVLSPVASSSSLHGQRGDFSAAHTVPEQAGVKTTLPANKTNTTTTNTPATTTTKSPGVKTTLPANKTNTTTTTTPESPGANCTFEKVNATCHNSTDCLHCGEDLDCLPVQVEAFCVALERSLRECTAIVRELCAEEDSCGECAIDSGCLEDNADRVCDSLEYCRNASEHAGEEECEVVAKESCVPSFLPLMCDESKEVHERKVTQVAILAIVTVLIVVTVRFTLPPNQVHPGPAGFRWRPLHPACVARLEHGEIYSIGHADPLAVSMVQVIFELLKDWVFESTKKEFRPIVEVLFAELTVLGFLGLLVFIIQRSNAMGIMYVSPRHARTRTRAETVATAKLRLDTPTLTQCPCFPL